MDFNKIETLEELKKEYRRFCLENHPDKGGDEEMFKLGKNKYEERKEALQKGLTDEEKKKIYEYNEEYEKAISMVIGIEGIKLELIGSWVWASGNTYPHKKAFKEAGFNWSGQKKLWYFRDKDHKFKRKGKGSTSMEDIRAKYGSQDIEGKKNKKLN